MRNWVRSMAGSEGRGSGRGAREGGGERPRARAGEAEGSVDGEGEDTSQREVTTGPRITEVADEDVEHDRRSGGSGSGSRCSGLLSSSVSSSSSTLLASRHA